MVHNPPPCVMTTKPPMVWLYVSLALLAQGCFISGGTSGEEKPQRAVFSRESPDPTLELRNVPGSKYTFPGVRPGNVVAYASETLGATARTTLESAEPLEVGSGLEFLEARLNFDYYDEKLGRWVMNGSTGYGYPGSFCTSAWPPVGFGPTYPVAGFDFGPKQNVIVFFYLRVMDAGTSSANGSRIEYSNPEAKVLVGDSTTVEVEVSEEGGDCPDDDPYFQSPSPLSSPVTP